MIIAKYIDEKDGPTCWYGLCLPKDIFTTKQEAVIHDLLAEAIGKQEEFHYKEIKLLRSKHRKAVKKLKLELQEAKLFANY